MSIPARRSCATLIKATVGFEKLGEATGTPAKSLIGMLGPRGNPQARNLFGIIGYLQKQAGVELHVADGGAERCWPATLRRRAAHNRGRSQSSGGGVWR